MESKSSKTKKWKRQVIRALDVPHVSCLLPSLRAAEASIGSMHVYPVLTACQTPTPGGLTAGARGALATCLAADGFHPRHSSPLGSIRHRPNFCINDFVPPAAFLPSHRCDILLKTHFFHKELVTSPVSCKATAGRRPSPAVGPPATPLPATWPKPY